MNKRNLLLGSALIAGILCLSGCASVQKKGASEIDALKATLQEKDSQVTRMQTVIDDQQQQLRDLNDQLKNCMKKLKAQPNLK